MDGGVTWCEKVMVGCLAGGLRLKEVRLAQNDQWVYATSMDGHTHAFRPLKFDDETRDIAVDHLLSRAWPT